jgi:cytochrome c2
MKPILFICALALVSCKPSSDTKLWASQATGGNPDEGPSGIRRYGCASCHMIDGISSKSLVGPPLIHMAGRSYLAGNMENTAANMVQFIQHPRQVHNDTAMPEMGVTDQDARDIAAYLYTFQ